MNNELVNCLLVQVNNGISLDEAIAKMDCQAAYDGLLHSQQAELNRAEAERNAGLPLAQQVGWNRVVSHHISSATLDRHASHSATLGRTVSAEVMDRLHNKAAKYQDA